MSVDSNTYFSYKVKKFNKIWKRRATFIHIFLVSAKILTVYIGLQNCSHDVLFFLVFERKVVRQRKKYQVVAEELLDMTHTWFWSKKIFGGHKKIRTENARMQLCDTRVSHVAHRCKQFSQKLEDNHRWSHQKTPNAYFFIAFWKFYFGKLLMRQ